MNPGWSSRPRRGEIWWICLDPTVGSEIRKTRPCLVVNSDALDRQPLRIVVPLTGWKSKHERIPWCIRVDPGQSNGLEKPSAADALQVRAVSIERRRFTSCTGNVIAPKLAEVVLAIGLCLEHPPPGVSRR